MTELLSKEPPRYVEPCLPEELSVEGIRRRSEAFNFYFERNGGYKTYEAQAIDALLAEIERLTRE